MTALRVLIFVAACLLTAESHASSNVQVGSGVYKPTASRWAKAIDSASFDSDSWVWNLGKLDGKHRNKSRDTILMIPDRSVPDDLTLIVWFHGCSGFGQRTFSKRVVPQIQQIVEDGHSVALVVPEMPWSINTTTRCGRQGRVWNKPGELNKFIQSVRKRLNDWATSKHKLPLGTVRLVFLGHSAGGSALMSAAREGSLCSLNPEAIVWSDSSYGYWLDSAWRSCIKNADTDLHVVVRKWDKPHRNASRVQRLWNRAKHEAAVHYYVMDRKIWSHGKIGNSIFSITKLFPPGC